MFELLCALGALAIIAGAVWLDRYLNPDEIDDAVRRQRDRMLNRGTAWKR
jgi:hypothetical protein